MRGWRSPVGFAAITDAFHIAELNIALAKEPLDTPLLADFMAALDPINALADGAPGFVWRLQAEDGNATSIKAFEDERMIVNLTVWESVDDLVQFVYRSGHVDVMRRRREWFERILMHMVLWWVPAGHIPGVDEALDRLAHLREHGPTPHAFTFRVQFPAPALADDDVLPLVDDEIGCPA
jgi:Domain of unknown function (DUF3291)